MTVPFDTIKGNGFSAEIIRTKRKKTVSVQVREGKVSVLVPRSLPNGRIEELVTKKSRWIREKLQLLRESTPVKPKNYINGERFTYLGRNYLLKVVSGSASSVKLKNGSLMVTLPDGSKSSDKIKDVLIQWYRIQAEQKLREKVDRYAKIVGAHPASVSIKTFKSRWGSCSANGNIQFNWKIIISPHRIVDYVVVHELCHLLEHNHSPRYWKQVARVLPDHKECKAWLKENGRTLTI
jgi:predicted metal-dependent hydrolase